MTACLCRDGYSYGGPLSITNGPVKVRSEDCPVDNHADLARGHRLYNSVDPHNRREGCRLLGIKPEMVGLKSEPMRCPDDGACHHSCGRACFRVRFCGPLSGVYPNDRWPDEVASQQVDTDPSWLL